MNKTIGILFLIAGIFLFSGCITEISDADDTNINSPTTGQLLTYENGIWINKDFNTFDINVADLNVALPDLSDYVDWVDGNNTYVIKSDLNDLIPKIGDINCINGDKVLGYVEGFSC